VFFINYESRNSICDRDANFGFYKKYTWYYSHVGNQIMALSMREEMREHDDLSSLLSFTLIHSRLRYTCINCMRTSIGESFYPRDISRNL